MSHSIPSKASTSSRPSVSRSHVPPSAQYAENAACTTPASAATAKARSAGAESRGPEPCGAGCREGALEFVDMAAGCRGGSSLWNPLSARGRAGCRVCLVTGTLDVGHACVTSDNAHYASSSGARAGRHRPDVATVALPPRCRGCGNPTHLPGPGATERLTSRASTHPPAVDRLRTALRARPIGHPVDTRTGQAGRTPDSSAAPAQRPRPQARVPWVPEHGPSPDSGTKERRTARPWHARMPDLPAARWHASTTLGPLRIPRAHAPLERAVGPSARPPPQPPLPPSPHLPLRDGAPH